MTIAGDTVYAAGIGIGPNNQNAGTYWTFDGQSWNVGQDVKFSHAIYAATTTKEGYVYLAGTGDEDRVLWENSKGILERHTFWKIAWHSTQYMLVLLETLVTGGWNKGRSGSVWRNTEQGSFDKGQKVPKCFVVRGITG